MNKKLTFEQADAKLDEVVAKLENVVKAPIKPVPIPAFSHAANSPRSIK